jgi:hypothetical protein
MSTETLGQRAAAALKAAKTTARAAGKELSWDEVATIIDSCVVAPVAHVDSKVEVLTVEAIYAIYPKKKAPRHAKKAIDAAAKRLNGREPEPLAYLLDRTRMYATAVSVWSEDDRRFVPHPATWFNADSFDENPREWERGVKDEGKAKDYSKL